MQEIAKQPTAPAAARAMQKRDLPGANSKTTITVSGVEIPVRQITIPAGEVADKTTVFTGNERIQDLLTETSLSDLLPDIRDHGQQHAGTGRKLSSGNIEVADGSRRRMAAIITDQPYTILVGDFSDAQMEQISESGNVYREPSAYEKGKKLTWKMENLHDGKLERLAKAEGQQKENLRRLIDTASLDEDIIKLYPSPNDLSARAGQQIAKLWNQKNDTDRTSYRSAARQAWGELKLKANRDETPLTAKEITNCLLELGSHSIPEKPQNLRGNVGTVKRTKTGLNLNLNIAEKDIKELQELIEDFLNEK